MSEFGQNPIEPYVGSFKLPEQPKTLTIEEVMATARELQEADAKTVKLVVFRTEGDLRKLIRNIPGDTNPMDVPQMIVAPEFIPGDAGCLCVADRDVAQAILKAKEVS